MKSRILTIGLIALSAIGRGGGIQLVAGSQLPSVYDAVQDESPALFNALQGVFDGYYGGDVNAIEVPSGMIAHQKELTLPSAYAIGGGSGPSSRDPFYDLLDDRDPLPGFSSYMITSPNDPAARMDPDRLGYQPVYNTPGLTGYGPDPSISGQSTGNTGYPLYRSSGE